MSIFLHFFNNCCVALLQDYKDCIDAEGLMPLNTSDVQKTICMEMRMAKAMNILSLCHGSTKSSSFVTPPDVTPHIVGPNKFTFPSIDAAVKHMPSVNLRDRNSSINSKLSSSAVAVVNSSSTRDRDTNNTKDSNLILNHNYNSNNADLASVDSSDTFMSCQTHPFLSQGDLTGADCNEINVCSLDMLNSENLYMNAMSKNSSGTLTRGGSLYTGGMNIVENTLGVHGHVKKSASGDTALRSLAASPVDENYIGERGSRVSLNETPVPKHRKTRFQQQQQQQQQQHQHQSNNLVKLKTRFDNGKASDESLDATTATATANIGNNKKNRRASFMPTKIITSATKQLINQHLFGIQSCAKGS